MLAPANILFLYFPLLLPPGPPLLPSPHTFCKKRGGEGEGGGKKRAKGKKERYGVGLVFSKGSLLVASSFTTTPLYTTIKLQSLTASAEIFSM